MSLRFWTPRSGIDLGLDLETWRADASADRPSANPVNAVLRVSDSFIFLHRVLKVHVFFSCRGIKISFKPHDMRDSANKTRRRRTGGTCFVSRARRYKASRYGLLCTLSRNCTFFCNVILYGHRRAINRTCAHDVAIQKASLSSSIVRIWLQGATSVEREFCEVPVANFVCLQDVCFNRDLTKFSK